MCLKINFFYDLYTIYYMDKFLISIKDINGNINEDLGIELISFVKNPAIMIKGLAFNSHQQKKIKFSTDEIKMRIIAPAMIPMDIYRFEEEENEEYEVQFTEEVIEEIRNKFMANLTNRNIFNLEHSQEICPAYILETWIVGNDPKADKSYSEFGIEVPKGTMMVMSQITDKDYYDKLVANEQCAYSIEGMFGFSNLKLSDIINKNKNKINMELMLPDGEHTIGEKIYIVKDGKVLEIKDVIKAEETPVEETKIEEEVKAEEVIEEKVEEEIKAEEVIEETKTEMAIDEAEVMTILQPKLDEIYKMIADLTAKLEDKESIEEVIETPVAMNIHQKFSNVMDMIKEKN